MSWDALNLANLPNAGELRPEFTLGGFPLLYPGLRHVFSGPPESGKTLCAYLVAIEEIRRGGSVIVFDFEMGPHAARDRLRELTATDSDLERLYYIEPEEAATPAVMVELVEIWKPTLVITDAAIGAYSLQGLDDNQRSDVERWGETWVRPFWFRNVATITIDHVPKKPETRSRYAIGSERKTGGADVHVGFEVVGSLHRGGRGLYKLKTHKDRHGWLPRPLTAELELASDPQTYAISCTVHPAGVVGGADAQWKPTALMEKVSRFLEPLTDEVPIGTVERASLGKAEYVRQAVERLVFDGFVDERSGARNARLLRSIHPFRERDLVPDLVPDENPDLVRDLVPQISFDEAALSPRPDLVPTSSLARDEVPRPSSHPLRGVDGTDSVKDEDQTNHPVPEIEADETPAPPVGLAYAASEAEILAEAEQLVAEGHARWIESDEGRWR